jgi:hypothetical protein
MAVLGSQPAAAGAGGDLVGSALGKVIRALPGNAGRQAAALREHTSAAPDWVSGTPGPRRHQRARRIRRGPGRALITYRSESAANGRPRWTRGRSSPAAGAGISCATPTMRGWSAPAGPTGSGPSGRPRARSSRPGASTRWQRWKSTWAPGGSSPPASCSTHRRQRWHRGSGLPWNGWSRRETGACSWAARATRRCTRRGGWRACRLPSASRAARNSAPRSRRSLRVWLLPWTAGPGGGRRLPHGSMKRRGEGGFAWAVAGTEPLPCHRRPMMPRTKAAWPACCMPSLMTLTSRTPSVTGGSQDSSTTRGRSASVRPRTYRVVISWTASW